MSTVDVMSLTITYKGSQFVLSILPSETWATLQDRLHELTSVPPAFQKLIYKGKKARVDHDDNIEQVGIKDGIKIMLLGSTEEEVGSVRAAEAEKKRRDEIIKQRALRGPTKIQSTSRPSLASNNYKFHNLQPLSHLPSPDKALDMLKRLANDAAVAHVMDLHRFSVGVLTELAPHEHPHLLGLNQNEGAMIKLRLRTDGYDGFRNYREIRRVLCHELTHCVWLNHDDNFKTLNSQLNREVAEFERASTEGSHILGGHGIYEAEFEADAQSLVLGSYVLGGNEGAPDSREERRRLMLEAAAARLQKEEEEIEDMCGSAGPHAPSDT